MSSSEPPAAGKPTATPLDDKDEELLARFLAAGAQHLFEYPSKEEASGKKGKQDKVRRRANRDARNLSALQTLEAPAANYQPEEPDEQSVLEGMLRLGVPREVAETGLAQLLSQRHTSGTLPPSAAVSLTDEERPPSEDASFSSFDGSSFNESRPLIKQGGSVLSKIQGKRVARPHLDFPLERPPPPSATVLDC